MYFFYPSHKKLKAFLVRKINLFSREENVFVGRELFRFSMLLTTYLFDEMHFFFYEK